MRGESDRKSIISSPHSTILMLRSLLTGSAGEGLLVIDIVEV
jgi:hypothetical protein